MRYVEGPIQGAGGVSGEIYRFLGLDPKGGLPEHFRTQLRAEGEAAPHAYGWVVAVHVISPNLIDGCRDAVAALKALRKGL